MQFSACLNPSYVRNQYTGQMVQVPCGHCAACIVNRPRTKVQRLKNAREDYYDSLFFTLTFSNKYVPQGILTEHFVFHNVDLINDKSNFVNLKDYYNDRKYIEVYEREIGFLPLLSRRIVREFISYFKERFSFQFDWFITGEYGPTTFRPHYHGLLFVNPRQEERRVNIDDVADLLSECWSSEIYRRLGLSRFVGVVESLGETRIRYDLSSSAQYTAAYLNATSNIPRLLCDNFPPFSEYSRTLSVVDRLSTNEIREFLFTGSCQVSSTKVVSGQRVVEYAFPQLNTIIRYFPKFRGSNNLSDNSVKLLVLYICSVSCEAFLSDVYEFFGRFGVFYTLYKIFNDTPNVEQLKRFYYTIRSLKNISERFYVPLLHYLYIYSVVYSNYELFKLKQFYELQEQIADDPFLDSRFINGLYLADSPERFPFPNEDSRFCNLENNPLFIRYANLSKKILLDTSKTKKRNGYITPF